MFNFSLFLFYTIFEGFLEKVFVVIEKTIFPLYNMHIVVFIAYGIRGNYRFFANSVLNVFRKVYISQNLWRSTYSVTIIRSVIVNTVESAKTWCQNNSDFPEFFNCRITVSENLIFIFHWQTDHNRYSGHKRYIYPTLNFLNLWLQIGADINAKSVTTASKNKRWWYGIDDMVRAQARHDNNDTRSAPSSALRLSCSNDGTNRQIAHSVSKSSARIARAFYPGSVDAVPHLESRSNRQGKNKRMKKKKKKRT